MFFDRTVSYVLFKNISASSYTVLNFDENLTINHIARNSDYWVDILALLQTSYFRAVSHALLSSYWS